MYKAMGYQVRLAAVVCPWQHCDVDSDLEHDIGFPVGFVPRRLHWPRHVCDPMDFVPLRTQDTRTRELCTPSDKWHCSCVRSDDPNAAPSPSPFP